MLLNPSAADLVGRPQGQGNLFHIELVKVERIRSPTFQRRNLQNFFSNLFHLGSDLFSDKFGL